VRGLLGSFINKKAARSVVTNSQLEEMRLLFQIEKRNNNNNNP
jgi:hypothetical protein